MPAARSTAKVNRAMIAVMNQAQTVKGMRIRLMPRVRRSKVVTMMLIAPNIEAMQKTAIPRIHRVCPQPMPVVPLKIPLSGG